MMGKEGMSCSSWQKGKEVECEWSAELLHLHGTNCCAAVGKVLGSNGVQGQRGVLIIKANTYA